MSIKSAVYASSMTLALALAAGTCAWSQDAPKPKDDALDSLLEKLSDPSDGARPKSEKTKEEAAKPKSDKTSKSDEKAKPPASQPGRPGDATKKEGPSTAADKGRKADQDAKAKDAPSKPKTSGSGKVDTKDQELDSFLEKLGETPDKPSTDERRGGGGAPMPGEKKEGQEPQPAGGEKPKADPAKLGGKDKAIDERLEELTGRKKKKPNSDQQQGGPMGDIVKEMRDVEQRLGKPDTGDDTQKRQKQIVKRIETVIEQVRQSGSSGGRMVIRRVRKPGSQQPGQQQGQQQGAMAQGAPNQKLAKPTSQHSTADGRHIWGHLPDALRLEIENSFKETPLSAKQDLIDRYYLSVGKGKLVREE